MTSCRVYQAALRAFLLGQVEFLLELPLNLLGFLTLQRAVGNQLFRVDRGHRGPVLDFLVEQQLRESRLISLVVAVPAAAIMSMTTSR